MAHKKTDSDLVAMMQRIQKGTLDPDTLRPALRRKMVLMLIKENSTISNAKIGALVGMSDSQVGRVRRAAIMGTTYDIDTEVRHLVNIVWMKSQEYQRRAVADGDPRAAWSIFKESVEVLQGLGFVFEAPKKIALAHFQGQGDFKSQLRAMFDEAGVPALPEFMARLKLLASGGNGNGNGNGNGTGHGAAGTGGGNGNELGHGRIIDVPAAVVAGSASRVEEGGHREPAVKKDKD